MIETDQANVDQILGAADDPIVWQRSANRWKASGVEVRTITLQASSRDRLLAAFGIEWLHAHLIRQEAALDAWAHGGVH